MNRCQTCGKETKNPKFCSRSCSAVNSNRKSPKVLKKKRFCKTCGVEIFAKYGIYCFSCCENRKTLRVKRKMESEERLCSHCQRILPLSEFYKSSKDGNKYWCKKCSREDNTGRIRSRKLKGIEYLGGKCSRCGYDKCPDALEFHHLNPEEKDSDYRKMRYRSFEKVKKELDKCILVCANCHREIHFSG